MISKITRWKKKKHHEHFISPPVTPYGRPNNGNCCHMNSGTKAHDVVLYQRGSIASYASAGIAIAEMSVGPSERPFQCQ